MSLSRKLYFPKSLSFGAIRWSFLALASFKERNSLRSIHSFSSCTPCASLHKSSSVHVPLRYLSGTQGQTLPINHDRSQTGYQRRASFCGRLSHLSQTLKVPVGNRYCQQFWSSSELKTLSLCFSDVMCCCHCFSLLQFLPHSQQWLPACERKKNKTAQSHWHRWLITVCFLIIQIYLVYFNHLENSYAENKILSKLFTHFNH